MKTKILFIQRIFLLAAYLTLLSTITAAPDKQALFVWGKDTNGPADADEGIAERLVVLGYTVVKVRDRECLPADANGKALIYISSSVSSANVLAKFKEAPVPVMSAEHGIIDDMKWTQGKSYKSDWHGAVDYSESKIPDIQLVGAPHELCGGLSNGVYTYDNTTSGGQVGWGNPVDVSGRMNNVTLIAHLVGEPNKFLIFGFEKGCTLSDGVSVTPARRVYFSLPNLRFNSLTETGLKLFDAAVLWVTASSG